MQIVNGHILILSLGLGCLMVGVGAALLIRAIKDFREMFGAKND